jgi:TM2 domain-containing membrane protein YozV
VIAYPECEKQVFDQALSHPSGVAPIMGNSTARPNRGVAAILSFIIPGLGQMYLGKVGSGFVYLLSTAFCYAAAILLIMDANRTGVPGRNGGIIAVFTALGLAIPLVSTFRAAVARPGSR